MKYLIIKGTSVFGKPLIERLINKETTEQILATKLPGEKTEDTDKISWMELDVCEASKVSEIIHKADADVIFDLAAQDSVGYAWRRPNETVDINVIGTINVLNAVKELDKNPRIVIGGSGEEYGHLGFDHLPIREEEMPHPINIFGATKAAQTLFTRLYARAYGLDVVVLRTFNETSIVQDDKWAISSFCHQFVRIERGQQKPVIHVGNTNIIRDFTDVEDLARAFEMVAEKGKSGEVYNAARGKGVSIMDILNMLQDITGVKVEIHTDRSKVRPIDAPSIVADVSRIKEDVGWEAQVDIRDTLIQIVDMWREQSA